MISIIIPALNEEKALPSTLNAIMDESLETEIIVVAGGSTDNTTNIVKKRSQIRLIESERGRAKQMNAGAAIAQGDIYLFLHADTLLPQNALSTINRLPEGIRAGCFHQRFSKQHWFLRLVSRLHNWRCNRSRIMYGDQAMFIHRDLFEQIGGFPEEILEDVLISEKIVERTQPILLQDEVITSSRKFEQRGLYRSFFDIFIIMSCYELKLPLLRQAFFGAFR